MPGLAGMAIAAARDAGVGVLEGNDHARHAGLEERIGARRRSPVVRAGLERHVRGVRGPSAPRAASGGDLSVRPAGSPLCGSFSDDRAVTHEEAANPGVRGGAPTRALAEGHRPIHELGIAVHAPVLPTAGQGAVTRARALRRTLSHPDSHRRLRHHAPWRRTGSTTRLAAVGSRAPAGHQVLCGHRRSGLSPNPEG